MAIYVEEVAVVAEADPFAAAGGVWALQLVFPMKAFLSQVATKVALYPWPEGHRAVPSIVFCTTRDF